MNRTTQRFSLRLLPLGPRLVIAAFLISVGVGYCAALVQVHFQHASPGKLLPDSEDAVSIFHGGKGVSEFERLITAGENRPFSGSGSMRQAFTAKSAGWKVALRKRAREKSLSPGDAEKELRAERDGECLALLDWVHAGARKETFEDNNHPLSATLAGQPITPEFVEKGPEGTRVKIAALVEARCARCHSEGATSAGSRFPLETWEQVHDYCEVNAESGGLSLPKLAQSTHIHLLGFAMLYGMTGLIFALTSYPGWLKVLLAPLPLVVQLADISLWWLARLDPAFARAIMITGVVVGVGVFLQIVLSLFNLFGKTGKAALAALLMAACLGGYAVWEQVIDPYLAQEAAKAPAAK